MTDKNREKVLKMLADLRKQADRIAMEYRPRIVDGIEELVNDQALAREVYMAIRTITVVLMVLLGEDEDPM